MDKYSSKSRGSTPSEALTSMNKGFKSCLALATEFLSKKDYFQAHMIYCSILKDFPPMHVMAQVYHFNDLEVFSMRVCFAYSCMPSDREQSLFLINAIPNTIKLPLVPYLRAVACISDSNYNEAWTQVTLCENMIKEGYNFKPNEYLNENVIAEIDEEFLKMKLNGLKFVCEYLKMSGTGNEAMVSHFKETSLVLGEITDNDLAAKVLKVNENIKKGASKNLGSKTACVQTTPPKLVNAYSQTQEKELNKELLNAVFDIRNKVNNLQSKKDDEVKRLQKKVNELSDKLNAKDKDKKQDRGEFDFVKEKFVELETKLEESLQTITLLKNLLAGQVQQTYQSELAIFALLESQCNDKIEYLGDIQRLIKPTVLINAGEANEELALWISTLEKVNLFKQSSDEYNKYIKVYLNHIEEDNPPNNKQLQIPALPSANRDLIYKKFRLYLENNGNNNMRNENELWTRPIHPPRNQEWGGYPTNMLPMMFPHSIRQPRPNRLPQKFEDRRTNSFTAPQLTVPKPTTKVSQTPTQHQQQPQQQQQQPQQQQEQPQPQPSSRPQTPKVRPSTQTRVISGPGEVRPQPTAKPQSTAPSTISYASEENLMVYLRANFPDVEEVDLLDAIFRVREQNGGSLIGLSISKLVADVRKTLKMKALGGKNTNNCPWNMEGLNPQQINWENDHSETRCCICFEDYNSQTSYMLQCQHEFHQKCIYDWLKVQSQCPVCRKVCLIDSEFPALQPGKNVN